MILVLRPGIRKSNLCIFFTEINYFFYSSPNFQTLPSVLFNEKCLNFVRHAAYEKSELGIWGCFIIIFGQFAYPVT